MKSQLFAIEVCYTFLTIFLPFNLILDNILIIQKLIYNWAGTFRGMFPLASLFVLNEFTN